MVSGLAWIVAITLGLAGGGFMFHFPGSYGEPVWSFGAAMGGFFIGAVNGLVVGVLAWAALRLSRRTGPSLLGGMVLIVGGTHALNDGSSTQAPFVLVQALAGLIASGTAVWTLRERRSTVLAIIGITWTIGLVVGGWSGDLLGLPLTETGLGWAQDHAWDGLVTGLVWGVATALVGFPSALRDRDAQVVASVVVPPMTVRSP